MNEVTLPNGMRLSQKSYLAIDRQIGEIGEWVRAKAPIAMDPDWLARMISAGISDVSGFFFLFDEKEPLSYSVRDGIATLKIQGSLARKSSYRTTYSDIEKALKAAVADPAVDAVMLDVDSPGGIAAGAYECARAIRSIREEGGKPVWAHANDLMASAAYLVASGADQILAGPYSSVGSVGCVMMHVEFSKMNEKDGIKPTFIFAGKKKVWGNSEEPLDPGAKREYQQLVDAHYEEMLETISQLRPAASARELRATEAGMYVGEHAKVAKLTDGTVTFDEALSSLKESVMAANKEGTQPGMGTPAPAATVPDKGAEVIDLAKEREAMRGELRKELKARAEEIHQLCEMVGRPELAGKFIAEEKTADQVRSELLEMRKKDAGDDVSAVHGRTGTGSDHPSLAQLMTATLKAQGIKPRADSLSAFAFSGGEGK